VDASDKADLTEHLGADAATALLRWQDFTGNRIRVPADAWRSQGYTNAFVASLLVQEVGQHPVNLVAKVAEDDQRREGGSHRLAWHAAPDSFRRQHLVRLLFDGAATSGGHVIFFQELAGGTRECRPAAEVAPADLAGVCGAAATGLYREWTTEYELGTATVAGFLHRELTEPFGSRDTIQTWFDLFREAGAAALTHPATEWITTVPGERPLPNPLALAAGHAPSGERRIDTIEGRSHGDLHLENLLVLQDGAGAHPDSYRMIDLSTYREQAPLVRDQANLMLSSVAQLWPRLSDLQRELLLADLVAPGNPDPEQNAYLAATLGAIHEAGRGAIHPTGMHNSWQRQLVLAVLATALRFTTFDNLGADRRWWFFRLAAHAAARYAELEKLPGPQRSPVAISSPFADEPAPATRPRRPSVPLELRGTVLGGRSPGPIEPNSDLEHG
jgi:hypothetical protein